MSLVITPNLERDRWHWWHYEYVDWTKTYCATWWHKHWLLHLDRAAADGKKCRSVRNGRFRVPTGTSSWEIGPVRYVSSQPQLWLNYDPSKRLSIGSKYDWKQVESGGRVFDGAPKTLGGYGIDKFSPPVSHAGGSRWRRNTFRDHNVFESQLLEPDKKKTIEIEI